MNKNKKDVNEILKEIEENHNWPWIVEIYERNKENLNNIAIFYRGNNITYKEMFDNIIKYAKSLKILGIKVGDEIPACLENCPESIYLLGAASLIGAKINSFGDSFDKEYVTEIINDCNSETIFVTDNHYEKIKDSINESNVKRKVVLSLTDSLKNGINPYNDLDREFYNFENKVPIFKSEDSTIISQNEFLAIGESCEEDLINKQATLDDEFTITYSSGSTNSSRPKAIVHSNRSYISIGRFHDKDASDTKAMKDMTVLAQIPMHSNTNIASNISDTLMQGCTIALEPIYNKDFFHISLMINKPNFVTSTRSFIVNAMKKFEKLNVKLPYLMALFSVGEPLSPGEEKYCNKILRKVNAGIDLLPRPVSPVPISIAGGDCEHGGIFFNLFKAYSDKKPSYLLRGEKSGLRTFRMVECAVLDEKGNHCSAYQIGRLVANSPCNMKKYKNNPENTKSFFRKDSSGKTWGDCNVYAYYDINNRYHIKGRIMDLDMPIPPFVISDEILKDTKNIMSCEVIPIQEDSGEIVYVAHIEFFPGKRINFSRVINSIEQRLRKVVNSDIVDKICYRIRSNEDSYPLTCCGKRSNIDLAMEGITERCIKPVENNGIVDIITFDEYEKTKMGEYTLKHSIKI